MTGLTAEGYFVAETSLWIAIVDDDFPVWGLSRLLQCSFRVKLHSISSATTLPFRRQLSPITYTLTASWEHVYNQASERFSVRFFSAIEGGSAV